MCFKLVDFGIGHTASTILHPGLALELAPVAAAISAVEPMPGIHSATASDDFDVVDLADDVEADRVLMMLGQSGFNSSSLISSRSFGRPAARFETIRSSRERM